MKVLSNQINLNQLTSTPHNAFCVRCVSGDRNGRINCVYPGHRGPPQHLGPGGSGGLHGGAGGAGDRPLHGLQLGLRREPRQGPGAAPLHRAGGLGQRGVHVSSRNILDTVGRMSNLYTKGRSLAVDAFWVVTE